VNCKSNFSPRYK